MFTRLDGTGVNLEVWLITTCSLQLQDDKLCVQEEGHHNDCIYLNKVLHKCMKVATL